MSDRRFIGPGPWVLWQPSARVWRVVVLSYPSSVGVKFMDNGPDLYDEPVAWLLPKIFQEGKAILYPWVPIMQQEVWVPQPVGEGGSGGALTWEVHPGTQLQVTREIN